MSFERICADYKGFEYNHINDNISQATVTLVEKCVVFIVGKSKSIDI